MKSALIVIAIWAPIAFALGQLWESRKLKALAARLSAQVDWNTWKAGFECGREAERDFILWEKKTEGARRHGGRV